MSKPSSAAADTAAAISSFLAAGLWVLILWLAVDYVCTAYEMVVLYILSMIAVYARRATLWLTEG
jgi:hypothetical protein